MSGINIEIDEIDLREIIYKWLREQVGAEIDLSHIKIEVKSKQNYKSDWEVAEFRAVYYKSIKCKEI